MALILVAASSAAGDPLREKIVINAALENGLRPAAQLFDNRDEALAGVGGILFKSENLSLNGQTSCRTCHLDKFGSADGIPNAVGVFGAGEGRERVLGGGPIVPRNTLALWGRGAPGFETFFWDGKVDFSGGKRISQFGSAPPSDDALITAVHLPPIEIREMLIDDALVSKYKLESRDRATELQKIIANNLRSKEKDAVAKLATLLAKVADEITFSDIARSLSSFIRSEFRLKETKFQRFVFGNGKLSTDELKGAFIFYGKGKCVNCHNGAHFSDFKFHAIPFPQLGFGKNGFGVDYGRFNVTFRSEDLYKFRTPPLFNVERTAPYSHSGSVPTLEEAIVFHFDPLRYLDLRSMDSLSRHEHFKRMAATGNTFPLIGFLNDREASSVVSFLKTLSF